METTAEYAKREGKNQEYVRRLCRQGKLPSIRIGRQWFVIDGKGAASNADTCQAHA